MVFDLFKAYFFSNKTGSSVRLMAWLSLSGMAIGVSGLVIVLSVMAGFNENITDRLLSYEPHLVVFAQDPEQSLEKLEGLIQKKHPEAQILRFESQDLIVRTSSGVFQGTTARGLSNERMQELIDKNLSLPGEKLQVGSEEVVMNYDLARSIGALEGDYIDIIPPETMLKSIDGDLNLRRVKLVGTFFSQLAASKNSKLLVYRINDKINADSKNLRKGYEVLLKDPMGSEPLKHLLIKNGFQETQTWQDRNSSLLMALKLEKLAMTLFLGLSALITSFSMMTVLLLLIHKKRQDMGILMSMGLSKRQIRSVFGGIGLLLSLTGVFFGLVPGFLVAALIDAFPLQIMPSIYQDPYLPAQLDVWLCLSVTLFCLLICLLSFVIPIIRISNLNPTKALQKLVSE